MNSSASYVSRDNSTWIKGLLTVLIIMGHDMVFTIPLNGHGVMSYFYTFHIQGFFILPFLYGIRAERYSSRRLLDTVVRYYWPYFILVTVFMVANGIMDGFSGFNAGNILRMYFSCTGSSIKEMCGIQIFWFLPSMMTLVLLKELYYRNGRILRAVLLAISVGCIAISVFSNTSYTCRETWRTVASFVPSGGANALQMLAQGVLLRYIVQEIQDKGCFIPALAAGILCFCRRYCSVFHLGRALYRLF